MIYIGILIIIVSPFVIRWGTSGLGGNVPSIGGMATQNKLFLTFAFLILLILGSIRYDVGIDYLNYTDEQFPMVLSGIPFRISYFSKKIVEIGYFFGHGFIEHPYQLIFAIYMFLILIFLFLWIKEQSICVGFSVYLVIATSYYSYSFNAMRQCIAISIMLYATKFIRDKKMFKYFLFLLMACLFHMSVIIYGIFYFLALIKPRLLVIVGLQIGLLFIYPFGRDILLFLIEKTGVYESYIGSQFDQGDVNTSLVLLIFIICIVVLISYYFLIDMKSREKITYLLWFDIFLVMLLPIADIFPTVTRTLYMFFPINIVLVPNVLSRITNKYIRLTMYLVVAISAILFFCYFLFVRNGYQTLPYQTVFDSKF
ncbi:EpsG family protein [Companilactobacillus ginsenosidimutans]|uniref:EpsG family protein n=1 Tax=Companilactobacillus ginsenosidimutans TaxID=1007676 RepID=A0A0H4QK30_9LACO|nr:EpsG family protein [Companilactobacillus ginsenosidimutans]AKP67396.1 hypothetical protein ABM34_07495 [Companilactobacillus ginsenosidimutans]